MKHLTPADGARALYEMGISCHGDCTVRNGRKIVGIGYRLDKLTNDQREQLTARFSNIRIMSAVPQYAPEMRRPIVLFLTRAEVKRSLAELPE